MPQESQKQHSNLFITELEKQALSKMNRDIERTIIYGDRISDPIQERVDFLNNILYELISKDIVPITKWTSLTKLIESRDVENMNLATAIMKKYTNENA